MYEPQQRITTNVIGIQPFITIDEPFKILNASEMWETVWWLGSRFLFLFTGEESEITLLGDGSEPPEFEEWKWAAVDEVTELVRDQTLTHESITI